MLRRTKDSTPIILAIGKSEKNTEKYCAHFTNKEKEYDNLDLVLL